MPAQTGKSSLFKKLGGRLTSAMKKHAHDDINYGRVDLPGGIRNGVAQLTKCYFKQYENGDYKGEYYFRAEAVVVRPKEVALEDGSMKVEGLVTKIGPMPLCNTTTADGKEVSFDENWAKISNELKKLGADADELAEGSDPEAIAAAIQEAAPYVRFKTETGKKTTKYPNPRVWENWLGVIEDFDPEAAEDVEDETGTTEPEADVEEEEAPKISNGKLKAKSKAPKEDEPAEDEDTEEPDEVTEGDADLDTLAEAAQGEDDPEAQKKLTDIAVGLGISKKWVSEVAKTWQAVVAKIQEKQTEAEAGGDEEVEDETQDEEPEAEEAEEEEKKSYVPKKDDLVRYKGKKDKKPMEYEVISVNAKAKTCELKSIDDGKTKYVGVKFSEVTEV